MKVLFLSNLFPDATQPNRGIYNARLVKHLATQCEMRVVSPRPTRGIPPFWRPKEFTPRAEDAAFAPLFPPTAYIPKVGDRWNHKLMARSLRACLVALRAEFPFDAVLVSWIYPDACAVAELAKEMNFRFVAVAQGSDTHHYLQMPTRRAIIAGALADASAIITRSNDLGCLLAGIGLAREKLHTIYNGVETDVFRPGDKQAARTALGLSQDEAVLLYVGNLLPVKNPQLLLSVLTELRQKQSDKTFRLVMLGDGPLAEQIQSRAVANVSLVGRKPPEEVARYMQAADVLCIPSNNEGVPNVALEALACGLPVVATAVGGIPEILSGALSCKLAKRGDAADFASQLQTVLDVPGDPTALSTHAHKFSWDKTARAYLDLLRAE